jgi:hypothetical protein
VRGAQQLAGETAAQYFERLESEVAEAQRQLDRYERDAEIDSRRKRERLDDRDAAERERDFLRDQLTELQLQIASPSAPRTHREMTRLLAGLLRGEDWRNGTWR